MDDPNITIEEYIRLEEEKARRRGKVYNWETVMYGKIWDNEDVHDLESVKTEFPAIVFNDNLTSNETLSYEPTPIVSYFDDLDFFKDFENEFPAIVYNDALTSKSDFSIEPTLCPQHIDKFNLKDETSLSECYEVEQNVLYFNDLFPCKLALSTLDVLQRFGFFLQMGFILILATFDGLDVGLLRDVIGEDDCDDDG
ncbi:hypothetical protein Tco_0209314 [Tanacetum coccineum]